MEINSAIDLTQELVVAQQFADSEENNTLSRDMQFEQILVKELVPEPEVLKIPSQDLPSNGNQLPLDLIPTVSTDEKSIEVVIQPTSINNSELLNEDKTDTPDNVDLSSFLMTRLIIDSPVTFAPLPVIPTHKAFQMEPLLTAADLSTKSSGDSLNDPIMPDQLSMVTTPIPLASIPENIDDEVKIRLNDKPAGMEEQQAIKLVQEHEEKPPVKASDFMEALQIQLAENSPKSLEMDSTILEFKPEQKDPVALERSEVPLDQLPMTKEPLKQTMSLPNTGRFDEQFAEIFEHRLMDNVNWMVRRNENATQIQIDPPELGKIEISIEQNDDKTDIRFYAQVDQTRQLIESTLDKLKFQFSQNGMELGQVDVNAGNQGAFSQDPKLKAPVYQAHLDEPMMQTMAQSATDQLLDLYI
ncbi:MAG: flagellar hook-length control protein FliK [Candidatus Berkiella sp.]